MNTLKKTLPVAIPQGRAHFPKLNTPDVHPVYHPEGIWSCDVALDPSSSEFISFQMQLTEFGNAWMDELRETEDITEETRFKLPITDQRDRDKKPTGLKVVRTKLKAQLKLSADEAAVHQRVLILGPDGKPYDNLPRIGGGSVVRVGADAYCTYFKATDTFYVSLRLRGVQIVELVEVGTLTESDYSTYGFEALIDATSDADGIC